MELEFIEVVVAINVDAGVHENDLQEAILNLDILKGKLFTVSSSKFTYNPQRSRDEMETHTDL